MLEWTFDGKVVDSIPDGYIGFIYRINYADGTFYYGKKLAKTSKKLMSLKSGKKRKKHIRFFGKNKNHKRVKMEEVSVENDWKSYTGSSQAMTYENDTIESKEVIKFMKTKKGLTYSELELLVKQDALFDENCRNRNISGRFYPNVYDEE